MDKDEIMQRSWFVYLRYWKQEINDVSKPPTESGFWVWYAMNKLDK
jgi:hypothetical protein